MSITAINSMNNVNSFNSMQELQKKFLKLAAGNKINQAADDAAGNALAEKMKSASNGYSAKSNNDRDAINYYNVADSAYASINDNLSRLEEIGVRAASGIYSASDREIMQKEVDQIKQSINDTINQTEFNTKSVLNNNGSNGLANTNTSLDALGIADFDVTKNFNIDSVHKAIASVNDSRANIGAHTNNLTHSINSTDIANHNTIASMSKITDTDYGKTSTEFATQNAINQYSFMAMQANMNQYSILAQV